jgi:hypothetical protein
MELRVKTADEDDDNALNLKNVSCSNIDTCKLRWVLTVAQRRRAASLAQDDGQRGVHTHGKSRVLP